MEDVYGVEAQHRGEMGRTAGDPLQNEGTGDVAYQTPESPDTRVALGDKANVPSSLEHLV